MHFAGKEGGAAWYAVDVEKRPDPEKGCFRAATWAAFSAGRLRQIAGKWLKSLLSMF